MPLRHVAAEFDQHLDLHDGVRATAQAHGDFLPVANQFGLAALHGELLYGHFLTEERSRSARFGGGELKQRFDLRDAVVD